MQRKRVNGLVLGRWPMLLPRCRDVPLLNVNQRGCARVMRKEHNGLGVRRSQGAYLCLLGCCIRVVAERKEVNEEIYRCVNRKR
jgi:hypothetical protein